MSRRIHPNIHKLNERKIRDLVSTLNQDDIRAEASEVLRGLIDKVVINPRTDGPGCAIELHRDLATLLAFTEDAERTEIRPGKTMPGRRLSVVAGVGFESTTFRL